ncbi:hypothetical protein TNCV_3683831 [Trichonephila clavipes]|nr:hypothetical protein TNCV_3683831 [Trichonephila clavipes]
MEDNNRVHTDLNKYLETEDIQSMQWPSRYLDLNSVKHVWDALGSVTAAHQLPFRKLLGPRETFVKESYSFSQDLTDSHVNNMNASCKSCMAVWAHISY